MEVKVKTFTVDEHILFSLPEFVDSIVKQDSDVKKVGVFKVLINDNVKGHGTSLDEFIAVLKNRPLNVQKQFIRVINNHPNLYGYRALTYNNDSDCGEKNVDHHGAPNDAEKKPCEQKDFEDFMQLATDPRSYRIYTCCLEIVTDSYADYVVNRFYTEKLPQLVWESETGGKNISLSTVLDQGRKDGYNYDRFQEGLASLPIEERVKLIEKDLVEDKREVKVDCDCTGCCHGADLPNASAINRGVTCSVGINMSLDDAVRITKNFGLYLLPSLSFFKLLDHQYPDITKPCLYYGSYNSIFPMHIKDMSLFSWTYLHHGWPKVWICIPPSAVVKIHTCLAAAGVNNHSSCANLLGHKFFFPTIQWLSDHGIPFNAVLQRPGESVVLLPNVAHLAFDMGPNIAEACNFPTKSWIPYGIVAPKCTCMGSGGVHMDLLRVVAAMKPDMLQAYLMNVPPEVLPEEDPDFYSCILKLQSSTTSCTEDTAITESNTGLREERDNEEVDKDLQAAACPSLQTKMKGRKVLACPKRKCSKIYQHGKKQSLLNHVSKHHANDPDFHKLLIELEKLFPDRNKTERKTCEFCKKQIAGRAAQMRAHQESTGCIKRQ